MRRLILAGSLLATVLWLGAGAAQAEWQQVAGDDCRIVMREDPHFASWSCWQQRADNNRMVFRSAGSERRGRHGGLFLDQLDPGYFYRRDVELETVLLRFKALQDKQLSFEEASFPKASFGRVRQQRFSYDGMACVGFHHDWGMSGSDTGQTTQVAPNHLVGYFCDAEGLDDARVAGLLDQVGVRGYRLPHAPPPAAPLPRAASLPPYSAGENFAEVSESDCPVLIRPAESFPRWGCQQSSLDGRVTTTRLTKGGWALQHAAVSLIQRPLGQKPAAPVDTLDLLAGFRPLRHSELTLEALERIATELGEAELQRFSYSRFQCALFRRDWVDRPGEGEQPGAAMDSLLIGYLCDSGTLEHDEIEAFVARVGLRGRREPLSTRS